MLLSDVNIGMGKRYDPKHVYHIFPCTALSLHRVLRELRELRENGTTKCMYVKY